MKIGPRPTLGMMIDVEDDFEVVCNLFLVFCF